MVNGYIFMVPDMWYYMQVWGVENSSPRTKRHLLEETSTYRLVGSISLDFNT